MAEQGLENAEKDLERFKNLHEEGAVSAQELEGIRLAHKNARAQYNQALSMVDLVTPINGVVMKVDATEGKSAAPGVPLMTIATLGKVRVRCDVGQDEVGLLQPEQPVVIRLTTYKETGWDQEPQESKGVIGSVSLSADSETKLFMTEIVSENPNGILKPGMIAAVSVEVQKKENIIAVPATALIQREAGWFVFLVEQGKAKMTRVDIGVSDGQVTEVRTNLSVGDSLVVRGQFKLNDGIKVRLHDTASASSGDMAQD
jgi:RND family efflux transporter MFP subunit